ncbi:MULTISPECIES: Ldh family oxidoreductase [Thalassospira]|uniref:Sulfolactate dehydrogenase n=2 Tax=Thalassospira TaxID=168934 RepID=A0A367W7E9_9PROT|nr:MULTISPECIES: Ldh family oxidoreductase [Thalassospira]MDG4720691.1 Ldh family oxidoreductase [Thalassospira sp. FZY0004]RCK37343.1 sulfolactate dehydrogenase [Thalassospira profundimaris]
MKISLSDAHALVRDTMMRCHVSQANAASVATALVTAEASGQGGHGFRRVPAYSAQARAGKVDGHATPVLERTAPGVLRIDAQYGFAYPALDLMMDHLPDMARRQGIAIASFHKSHHAGVMGLTVERLAEQGLAAMMFANAPAAMAAWGGRRPMFGTNPIAFGIPVGDAGDPIIIDLALSKVARGKIMAAKQKGVDIPDDWAFDPEGNPTTDPVKALDGTMVPAGGVKGAALAMMVELLAAGMTGAQFGHQSSSLFDDKGKPPALGQMIIAIDPVATGRAGVVDHLAAIANEIASEEGVRLPGRRGKLARLTAEAEGIEIEDDVMAAINAII